MFQAKNPNGFFDACNSDLIGLREGVTDIPQLQPGYLW